MQDRYVLVLVGVIIITFLTFHQEICKAPFMPHLTDPEPPPLPPMLMQSKRQLLPDMDAEAPPATDVPSPTDPAPQLPPDPPPTGALLPLGPSLLLYKPTTAPMWDPTFVPRWQHLVSIPIMRSRHSMRLLDLCITSILYMTPYPKFDVLIMLDPPSRALIRKSFLEGRLEALNAQYLMVPDPIYVDDFYTGKYWWVDWPMLTQYKKVLYIDNDVLINADLNDMFDAYDMEGGGHIYAAQEGEFWRMWKSTPMFGLTWYKKTDYDRMNAKGIQSFNAGILMFVPDQIFVTNILEMRKWMLKWMEREIPHFTDQSFVNHWFNTRLLSKSILHKIQLFPEHRSYPGKILLHWCASFGTPASVKYDKMSSYLTTFIEPRLPKRYASRDAMVAGLLRPQMVIAEVGCFTGNFSQVLLETQPKELHLIDWFKGQGSGSDADGGTVVKLPGDQALQMLQDRFASSPQVNIHRNNSLHALAALQDRSLDAVYLDGDRGYDWLMQDMLLASAKVKPGGWIMGHDFYTYDRVTNKKAEKSLNPDVEKTVNAFLQASGLKIYAVGLDKQTSFAIRLMHPVFWFK